MVKIGYGIIGCGNGGHLLAKAIKLQPNAELKAVVSRNPVKAERFAQKFGADKWYTDYYKLLRSQDIDAVCISTPHYLHAQMTLDAFEDGKHVLCDKPMAVDLEEADMMINVTEKADMKLGVVFQQRFSDPSQKLRNAIDNDVMGNLIFGEARAIMPRDQHYYDSRKWCGGWDTAGGGVLISQAIHSIDLLRWFMGPSKSVWVQIDTVGHQIEVEDIATGAIQFKNGAFGIVSATTTPFLGPSQEYLKISGANGFVVLEEDRVKESKIAEINLKSKMEKLYSTKPFKFFYRRDYHARQIQDFTQSILEDKNPLVDGYEGRNTLELVLGMYESAKTGKVVNF